jgi:hypothetical protein
MALLVSEQDLNRRQKQTDDKMTKFPSPSLKPHWIRCTDYAAREAISTRRLQTTRTTWFTIILSIAIIMTLDPVVYQYACTERPGSNYENV